MAELRYGDVVALVHEAWTRGENSPTELRMLFMLAGRAAGSLGDKAAARLWFSRWLALAPDARLPPGTSPKLVALASDARDHLVGEKLAVRAESRGGAIVVTVDSDPVELARSVRRGAQRAALNGGAATLRAGDAQAPIELLDAYGNVLATVKVRVLLDEARRPRTSGAPMIQRWPVWAIATAGLAAIGGGGLWFAVDARDDIRRGNAEPATYPEVQRAYKRFDKAMWVSRIAFGSAAVTAVIGTVFYVRARGESRVFVAPAGDGVQASWSVKF